MLAWQHKHLSIRCISTADDDFVICRNPPFGQVLVLPIRCLVRVAADDGFVSVIMVLVVLKMLSNQSQMN